MPTLETMTTPSKWPFLKRFLNGIPGPFVAKVTRLWKVYHVLRGSYRQTIGRLHEKHGPLIQVGPNEYSLSDKGLVYIPKLNRAFFAVDTTALQNLEQSLTMANVFRNEHLIDKCNHQFITLLADAAEKGERVELSPLLARYAYETMLATTTGQFAGFLEEDPDVDRIKTLMKEWKFYAVLYGSYLKYHPYIATILRKCGLRSAPKNDLFRAATNVDTPEHASSSEPEDEQRSLVANDIEARIALTLAGADPTIVLLRTALTHIYGDPELLQQLRDEIHSAKLSDPPSFRELIAKRGKMPLLHAVLVECIRLNTPLETGPTYTTREEDVEVGGHKMPQDTTISLEPTVAHVNPEWFGDDASEFQPTRWLACNFETGSAARYHLLAYNLAYNANNLEEFQVLIACKMISKIVVHLPAGNIKTYSGKFAYEPAITTYLDKELDMKPLEIHGEQSSAYGADIDLCIYDSLSDQEILHTHVAKRFLIQLGAGGSFDVSRESYMNKKFSRLTTNKIPNYRAITIVKEVLMNLFGPKVWVRHNYSAQTLTLSPRDPSIPFPARKSVFRGAQQADKPIETKSEKENKPRERRHEREIVQEAGFNYGDDKNKTLKNSWVGWCRGEEAHELSFKSDASYAAQSAQIKQMQAKSLELKKEATYKKTAEPKATVTEPEPKKATGFVPPHLRGKKTVAADEKTTAPLAPHHRRKASRESQS